MRHERNSLRNRVYIIVFRSDTKAGKLFDILLLWLIILSILLVFMESVESFRRLYHAQIRLLEWGFSFAFTVEYLLRVYSTRNVRRYLTSFYGIIDLLALLPGYFVLLLHGGQYFIVLRAIRLLRVFRILKLTRYLYEGNVLGRALKASMYKITVFVSAVVTLVTIVGTLMYVIEGEKNGFNNIPESIYWAVVTVTTVGYGDVSPATPLGRLVASVLMIIGYGIIAVPTGIVSVEIARVSGRSEPCPQCRAQVESRNARFCSNCGARLEDLKGKP